MRDGRHFALKDRGWCPMECSPWPGQIEPCADCPYLAAGAEPLPARRLVAALLGMLAGLLLVLAVSECSAPRIEMTEDPRIVRADGWEVGASWANTSRGA